MAERYAAHRKSQLFLHSIIPVQNTHEELLRKKLKRGKFLFTKTSLIKITGFVILIAGIALFLAKPACSQVVISHDLIYPIALGLHVIVALTLYAVFSLGLTLKNPGFWVKSDIVLNILLSISTITVSILTNVECSSGSPIHKVPGPLGIVGGVMLIISCGGILLLYRYREDENEVTPSVISSPQRMDEKPRKSVLV